MFGAAVTGILRLEPLTRTEDGASFWEAVHVFTHVRDALNGPCCVARNDALLVLGVTLAYRQIRLKTFWLRLCVVCLYRT